MIAMGRQFKLGDVTVQPGQVGKGELGSVEMADSSRSPVPLIVVNGAKEGPILAVVCAIHGNELSAIGAFLEVVSSIDPKRLSGTLVGIPGGNPLAVRSGAYITTVDGVNLSGPWYLPPQEKKRATITQRMAYYINDALEAAEYVIDMHANPLPSMPFVLKGTEIAPDDRTKAEVNNMARSFGTTIISSRGTHTTNIRASCTKAGKPAITAELAGNIYLWDEVNIVGARGVRNVMRAIGMLDSEMEKQDVVAMQGDFVFCDYLVAQRGGLMFVRRAPGEYVPKGEPVVDILDVYGDLVEQVTMPLNGYCWSFTGGSGGSHAVSEGDKLAYVFAEASELDGREPYAGKPV